MTNPSGTRWESRIVQHVLATDTPAGRYPKRAQAGEPDVWMGAPEMPNAIPLVVWKRLVGKMADGRRKPDGEPAVVIMAWSDFIDILGYLPLSIAFDVQAKATAKLNVTRTLAELRGWIKERRAKT